MLGQGELILSLTVRKLRLIHQFPSKLTGMQKLTRTRFLVPEKRPKLILLLFFFLNEFTTKWIIDEVNVNRNM